MFLKKLNPYRKTGITSSRVEFSVKPGMFQTVIMHPDPDRFKDLVYKKHIKAVTIVGSKTIVRHSILASARYMRRLVFKSLYEPRQMSSEDF